MKKFLQKLTVRNKLLFMTVPVLIVYLTCMTLYGFLVKDAAKEATLIYYNQLFEVNDNLTQGDRDFYQAYCALLKLTMVEFTGYGDREKNVNDFDENMDQVYDRLVAVHEIIEQYPEMHDYKPKNGTVTMGEAIKTAIDSFTLFEKICADGVSSKITADYVATFEIVRGNINEAQDIVEDYAIKESEELDASINAKVLTMTFVSLIAVVVCVTVVVIVIRYLRVNATKMAKEIGDIAKKDLTVDIERLDGVDELVQLNHSSIALKEQLGSMMSALKNASGELNDVSSVLVSDTASTTESMNAIDVAVNELAETATQQAKDATDISINIADVNTVSEATAGAVEKLTGIHKDIETAVGENLTTVKQLTEITEKSLVAYNSIFKVIDDIAQKAKNIGSASSMIAEIASQTNLLALNANIEAARAGEAGRGFAVVADEIGKLAAQSAESASSINSMLAELSGGVETAVNESDIVKNYIKEQGKSVETTRDGFNTIASRLNEFTESVDNLNGSSEKLYNSIGEITTLISSLSASAQENAATAQELAATTTTVLETVTRLKTLGTQVDEKASVLDGIVSEYKI